ncbi:hypothetical protein GIB67_002034, partial [Kingdonia uniflora]
TFGVRSNFELFRATKLGYYIGCNRLRSLQYSFKDLLKLVNLDLSSNYFVHLPDTLGNLACLKRLNVETNELEELPYIIGSCSSLTELRLDFNNLRVLPEAIGKLECLEILTLHYNQFTDSLFIYQAVVQYMVDIASSKDVRSHPTKKKTFGYGFAPYLCIEGL